MDVVVEDQMGVEVQVCDCESSGHTVCMGWLEPAVAALVPYMGWLEPAVAALVPCCIRHMDLVKRVQGAGSCLRSQYILE